MKLILVSLLFGSSVSYGATQISCKVENPCAWLNEEPGYPGQSLGYCVEQITGDVSNLTLVKTNSQKEVIEKVQLSVAEFSDKLIKASASNNSVLFQAAPYDSIWAGDLVIKTPEAPGGLGFFVACDVK